MNRVDALLDWAVGLRDKAAVRFEGREITFGELADRIAGAAGSLAGRVRRGDRVGLYCENTPEFVVAEYACFWLGATVSPLNRQLTSAEVRETAQRLGLSVVLADGPLELGDVPVLPVPDGTGPAAAAPPPPERMGPEDGCLLLQTSGSTGTPKGVLLSYANVVDNYDRTYRWVGATGADVLLMALPLYNTYGLNQGINLMAVTGATLVLHRGFSPRAVLRALRDEGVTFFPSVPTMMTRLQAVADGPITDRVVRVGVGAAPTASQVVADVWRILPNASIRLGYGLSEATALVTLTHVGGPEEAAGRNLDTCGRAVPGFEMRIDRPDETGLGELLLRGDGVFAGYVGTEAPRPVEDGWLRTGDMARIVDGELVIADRKRDLVIRGGQNVYPGEIERVLHELHAVLEAAVIGRPHPDLGEVPVAYVVARPGHDLHVDAVAAHCAERLAGYKRPAEIVVVDALPRGATGKISKPALRERDALQAAGR
ncbi:acyl--CoA ligase [Pseudonocardia sp. C8]|uniref:class I adenylate-forming enzyme family protein n=1 Tax=Pseudonocardia sp. C8 TaxID=2762759 RepID=UPI001642C8DE|nr:class I adenylate-forming enzyme family protein [Pseudonocardia sp. C8]MBC3191110.1 acyl--CoA ligase [Pseudonocardia sp. C8]